jgi:hypothetical protein
MVRSLVRRLVASALLFVVGAGGGGLPILDTLVFHGPDRLAEAARPHYEASSASCHADGCSVRSLAQSRVLGDGWTTVRIVTPAESSIDVEPAEPDFAVSVSHPYLSRAPPPSV